MIDTGKLRWVFRDFPLDQVALTAAMVARYLPPDRYEPFVMALFANQDRWAFARGINTTEELWKTAALAGMGRDTFDKAIGDTSLRTWILQQQDEAQKKWGIDSTPSFVVNGKKYTGEMSFDAFRKLIPDVTAKERRLPVSFRRLRIVGFKSFAEPVSVEIMPGLTGIVGPNGCGKSNVVEALRWAMGENSARPCAAARWTT